MLSASEISRSIIIIAFVSVLFLYYLITSPLLLIVIAIAGREISRSSFILTFVSMLSDSFSVSIVADCDCYYWGPGGLLCYQHQKSADLVL